MKTILAVVFMVFAWGAGVPEPARKPIPIIETEDEFWNLVREAKVPLVVAFTAPWCGHCQGLKPKLEELHAEYDQQVIFVQVDADKTPGILAWYGVKQLPTVFVMNDKLLAKKTGNHAKSAYIPAIKGLLAIPAPPSIVAK